VGCEGEHEAFFVQEGRQEVLIQITEQVYVPITSIKRISFFGGKATIVYIDGNNDVLDGEDAIRLKEQC